MPLFHDQKRKHEEAEVRGLARREGKVRENGGEMIEKGWEASGQKRFSIVLHVHGDCYEEEP